MMMMSVAVWADGRKAEHSYKLR